MGPCEVYDRKRHESVVECLKQFEGNIAVGPLFVCTCCHQTWFRKSVSLLKNTNIRRCSLNYCTKLKSVNCEEWICYTCLSELKDGKVPKLLVANGMKWSVKPPELDLHQLEERLRPSHQTLKRRPSGVRAWDVALHFVILYNIYAKINLIMSVLFLQNMKQWDQPSTLLGKGILP